MADVVFRPNVEVGVGGGLGLIAFNLEFAYKLRRASSPWTPYVGAGPALNIKSVSAGGGRDDTEVDGGFNVLVGLEHRGGLFTEFKVGASDSPDIKLTVGYSFR